MVTAQGSYVLNRLISSHEPKAQFELLLTYVVKGQLAGFWPNLAGIILIWFSLIIVQMVPVHCISRSHRLKINLRYENLKNFIV